MNSHDDANDLWVFGYGSLLWNPGFPYMEWRPAILTGHRRALCVYSVVHRGTVRHPGLVFGLDQGGVCEGKVFRVKASDANDTIVYLRHREQVTGVYHECYRQVDLMDGSHQKVKALCYLVDRAHPQYTGPLSLGDQALIVRSSHGKSGHNIDYVLKTAARLRELEITDRFIERLVNILRNGRQFPPAGATQSGHPGPQDRALMGLRPKRCRPRLHAHGSLAIHYRRHLGL